MVEERSGDMSIDERIYPCEKCGLMRNKSEGGTTFTLCDKCWDEHFNTPKVETNIHSFARSQAIEFNEYLRSDECDYWYDRDDKVYRGRYANIMATTKEMYSLFLTHQAKQSNTETK